MKTEAETIEVVGAAEHNLRGVSCAIPLSRLTVVTGPSGSGKSTLVFDVIAAELSSGLLPSVLGASASRTIRRPRVESVRGGSLPIVLGSGHDRARALDTFGFLSGLEVLLDDLWRLLGEQRCDQCGGSILGHSPDQIVDDLLRAGNERRGRLALVLVPNSGPLTASGVELLLRQGLTRFLWEGRRYSLEEVLPSLSAQEEELFVDARIFVDAVSLDASDAAHRLRAALRFGCDLHSGRCLVRVQSEGEDVAASERWCATVPWCPQCERSVPRLVEDEYSFRRPSGACPECAGFGVTLEFLEPELSERTGTVSEWGFSLFPRGKRGMTPEAWATALRRLRFRGDVSLSALTSKRWEQLLFGELGRRRFRPWQAREKGGEPTLKHDGVLACALSCCRPRARVGPAQPPPPALRHHLQELPCTECQGARFGARLLRTFVAGHSLQEWMTLPISAVGSWLPSLEGDEATELRRVLATRFAALEELDLGHLSLGRSVGSLSGGERRRAGLVSQLGGALARLLYLVDEPTLGLDSAAALRVLQLLRSLVREGNTVVVVEHDRQFRENADLLLEMGPGGGGDGGQIVSAGPPPSASREQIPAEKSSPRPPCAERPRLVVTGLSRRNLVDARLEIELGTFSVLAGPSGMGKTTALMGCLAPALRELCRTGRRERRLSPTESRSYGFVQLDGYEPIQRVIVLPQQMARGSALHRVLAGLGVEGALGELYARLPEGRLRGWKASWLVGKRTPLSCPLCGGLGQVRLHTRANESVLPCRECLGGGFRQAVFDVRYRGISFGELRSLQLADLRAAFERVPVIREALARACDLGLGYLSCGERLSELSEGELQRVRLVRKLRTRMDGGTLVLLDEPSRGLSDHEIGLLLALIRSLRGTGATVVAIDHHELLQQAAECAVLLDNTRGVSPMSPRLVS